MTKKEVIIIFCIVLSIVLLLITALVGFLVGIPTDIYSEKKHIQRITKRAEERFLGEDSEYTGLEVYPIYNEYDELSYALIEFEPQGFVYVAISDQAYLWKGMYTLSSRKSESWMPYRVKKGVHEDIEDENGNKISQVNREYFCDENGFVIKYDESHFKIAGIENERRYFLYTELADFFGRKEGLIPAVKRGEQYLDLVDGAMIDYTPGMESEYAVMDIAFINKSYFDL